jgi:hypothetical protein
VRVCRVFECVCEREKETEREKEGERGSEKVKDNE